MPINVIGVGPVLFVLLDVENVADTVEDGLTELAVEVREVWLPCVNGCAGGAGVVCVIGFATEQAIVNTQMRIAIVNQSDCKNNFRMTVRRYSEAPIEAFEDVTVIVVYPSLI